MRALAHFVTAWFYAMIQAYQWLTIVPLFRIPYSETTVRRSLVFYPLVGWTIGLVLVAVLSFFTIFFPPVVAGMLVLSVWIIISGGLHLDGFMDTADGILSHRSQERMLEIMKDSRVGAWGVISCVLLLCIKGTALIYFSEMITDDPQLRSQLWLFLSVIPMYSRTFMVWAVVQWPYARKKGFGSPLQQAGRLDAVLAISVSLLCMLLSKAVLDHFYWDFHFAFLLMLFLLTAIVGTVLASYINRKLGGLTGDTYGALNEFVEMILLLVITAVIYVSWG